MIRNGKWEATYNLGKKVPLDEWLELDDNPFLIKDKSRYETRRRKAQEKQRKMWRKKDR